ncbi:hypothetical protein TraAM80_02522 [Trypanosoma rangeli]|uniref:Beta-lactamase-related domain-containing protein n=1 Tax=Trypanosoma rangeli TaxID=5698 RepID=A0A422NUF1_TRYRA|nr:uncharacterized protein TraAM80_02522 [Trypanosoma rangeli]RNF09090.1 hypothetical protein TraAM80_02522 [Trypanosoma rangeli]|eukprot:RNF09090.1 hypothetical protein TraAM80_02522 [Trypanosoma rangeli]
MSRRVCPAPRRSGGSRRVSSSSARPLLWLLCAVAAVCFCPAAALASVAEIAAYFDAIREANAGIFAGAVVTWDGNGIDAGATTALGNQAVVGKTIPMNPAASFRTNSLSELFVDMTVAHLESANLLPFLRKQAIPPKFLPPPYDTAAFQNPLFPAAVVSLDTLLLHTSSLTEAGFESGAAQTPATVIENTAFIESVFSKAQNGVLWGIVEPGLGSSYCHSRLNTALVTYILDKVLAARNPPVSVATFIQNTFISPMGLSGTFLLDHEGNVSAPAYPTGGAVSLAGRAVQDVTADGSKVSPSVTIHAAYTADYMYYTTTLDLAKLAYELFLGGHYTVVGEALKTGAVRIDSGKGAGPGVVSRSLGVYGFDPALLCEEVQMNRTCDFGDAVQLYGWAVTGDRNQVTLLCREDKCVAAEVSYFKTNTFLHPYGLGLAMTPLIQSGRSHLPQGGELHAFYVFIGVMATLIVVVLASYIVDYMVQLAPATASIPVNKSNTTPLPMNGSGPGYTPMPPREQTSYATLGISSPVRRLDMYE